MSEILRYKTFLILVLWRVFVQVTSSLVSENCVKEIVDSELLETTLMDSWSNLTDRNGSNTPRYYNTWILKSSPKFVFCLKVSITVIGQSEKTTGSVTIGNDVNDIGKSSMTSYKIYYDVTKNVEIVSRENNVWIKVESVDVAYHVIVTYFISKPVTCNASSEFRCSPVQCVPQAFVCDGTRQCNNGRDEYCDVNRERQLSHGSDYFMCGGGENIAPTLPLYDPQWGRHWWYLCDGVMHCKYSRTDENPEICFGVKGRSERLVACQRTSSRGLTGYTWKQLFCHEKVTCDQSPQQSPVCRKLSDSKKRPLSMAIAAVPVVGLVLTVAGALIIRRFSMKRNHFTVHTEERLQMNEVVEEQNKCDNEVTSFL